MRIRHKQPTLVSMWMLDVFCCALGCVILLLLLKMREASITAEEARLVTEDLDGTQLRLLDSELHGMQLVSEVLERDGRIARVEKERDDTAKTLALVQSQRDEHAKNLALVRTERDTLAKKLAVAEEAVRVATAELVLARKTIDDDAKALALAKERVTKTDEELAKKTADVSQLAKKLLDAMKAQEEAQLLVREKEKARTDAVRQVVDVNDRLIAARAKLTESQKTIDDLMTKTGDAAKLRARLSQLEKQVADANVTIVDLQGTKAKLADKINKLEVEAEQRFAGIAMTGKKVVFLVDMSGSMDRTEENTPDATKWPTVRDTLLKVMRSLPDLEQFQVIMFSNKMSYLLGNAGEWLPYEREKSAEQVRRAMTAVKPVGDTNIYLGFEETFKFRAKGLDTIYFISDGLPTSGPGLTAAEDRTLEVGERSARLARYVRNTLKTTWNPASVSRAKVRINSIGFFYESPDVGAFLWALSRENDGSFVGMSRP